MTWTEAAPKYGDPVRTKVRFYYHYGIYVNEHRVIQFGLPDDPMRAAQQVRVLATDVYTFLQGGELEVGKPEREERKHMRSARQIVELAESRIGEGGYDVFQNNCEHFVNECVFGKHESPFLQDVRAMLRKKLGKDPQE